jgi:GNAT superfamily N-acetyltransferase
MTHPLDMPIWAALESRQAKVRQGNALARRFPSDMSPFVAVRDHSAEAIAAAVNLIEGGESVSFLEHMPPPAPAGVDVWTGEGVQMTIEAFKRPPKPLPSDADVKPLGAADAADMLELALLTRPGPFRINTWRMGRFVGIRREGRLIAMCGERLALEGYTELSGLCTHPDARGAGLGEMLLRRGGERILEEGDTPFLHAYVSNSAAIALYERMGFTVRTSTTHAVWTKSA